MRAVPPKEDEIMEDVDTGVHAEKSPSRQLFDQKSPLRATDPNVQFGTSSNMKDKINGNLTKVQVEVINIGGLEIMDCQT